MNPRLLHWTAAAAVYLAPYACAHNTSPALPDATGGREIAQGTAASPRSLPPLASLAAVPVAVPNLSPVGTWKPATAHAEVREHVPTGDALIAARMAWIEGGWSLADAAAVVHVIKRRAHRSGWTFSAMALRYSQLDGDSDRAAFARRTVERVEDLADEQEQQRRRGRARKLLGGG